MIFSAGVLQSGMGWECCWRAWRKWRKMVFINGYIKYGISCEPRYNGFGHLLWINIKLGWYSTRCLASGSWDKAEWRKLARVLLVGMTLGCSERTLFVNIQCLSSNSKTLKSWRKNIFCVNIMKWKINIFEIQYWG